MIFCSISFLYNMCDKINTVAAFKITQKIHNVFAYCLIVYKSGCVSIVRLTSICAMEQTFQGIEDPLCLEVLLVGDRWWCHPQYSAYK